jgi:hypothetical protein
MLNYTLFFQITFIEFTPLPLFFPTYPIKSNSDALYMNGALQASGHF